MADVIIENLWKTYEHACIPLAAPQYQRESMKQAFYAGASALFTSITYGLTEGPEPNPPDLAMMDAIDAELRAFAGALLMGGAKVN